jgi:hypothetical protein
MPAADFHIARHGDRAQQQLQDQSHCQRLAAVASSHDGKWALVLLVQQGCKPLEQSQAQLEDSTLEQEQLADQGMSAYCWRLKFDWTARWPRSPALR